MDETALAAAARLDLSDRRPGYFARRRLNSDSNLLVPLMPLPARGNRQKRNEQQGSPHGRKSWKCHQCPPRLFELKQG
jgi:hypothetical protein